MIRTDRRSENRHDGDKNTSEGACASNADSYPDNSRQTPKRKLRAHLCASRKCEPATKAGFTVLLPKRKCRLRRVFLKLQRSATDDTRATLYISGDPCVLSQTIRWNARLCVIQLSFKCHSSAVLSGNPPFMRENCLCSASLLPVHGDCRKEA